MTSPNETSSLAGLTRDDTIVLLFGQTGAGKSTFINHLVGTSIMKVGHDMYSETKEPSHYIVTNPKSRRRRMVLVDTPGFDDYKLGDREILDKIVQWLKRLGDIKVKLMVIYLVEIDQVRRVNATGMTPMKLAAAGMGQNLVVASTKWSSLKNEEVGIRRETELRGIFSSTVHRFRDSTQAAWEIAEIGSNSPIISAAEFSDKLDGVLPKVGRKPGQRRGGFKSIFSNLFKMEED